jgi:Tfp pilus assembly protein PilX
MPKQRGAILVVALILLVLLGVMGTTSLRSVIFQEKIAAQMHDRNLAFESAEAGLSWCEKFYAELPYAYATPDDQIESGRIGDQVADSNDPASAVFTERDINPSWYLAETFWSSSAHEADVGLADTTELLSGLAQNPRCVRERVVEEPSAAKYFSAAYSGKDDVMADKNGGSAIRSGGIYQFRTTAQGVGRGSADADDDRALTTVVLQADYFKRLE